MEYSLRKLDNEIPNYQGTVYRSGYFNKNGGQFFSSSKCADVAVEHGANSTDEPITFSIIKAKDGYDIETINANTRFAGEREVLFHPNSKFVDVTDEISEDELSGYYAKIKNCIKRLLKENLENEDAIKADDVIGSLRIYEQV